MDVQEAAECLRCTPDNVYKKVRSGSLPHYRNGKKIRNLIPKLSIKPFNLYNAGGKPSIGYTLSNIQQD
ncbi:helix-turn-helix domain-containing protein [Parapedobacter sp. ISTM3]|uniref:helix-turn-helix domain-containing protein n=1 Tax=Parapedobacter sp. ISTM3 TaxID=2800130 RepID=UPI0019066D41|nr:helix-turn-helix domain-containing protein [Parapedobacter sp. ISTM3]